MPKSSWAPPKGMRGQCERRRGNINADGAGAEVFAGDGCSQGASFGPIAAISRRWRGGRIYNNTRTRERLRRKCVKSRRPHHPFPAESLLPPPHSDTPSPSTSAPPRSADAFPSQHRCTPADLTIHSPPEAFASPRTATSPSRAFSHPLPTHFHSPRSADARPPTSQHSPPKIFALPEHFLTPFLHTSAPPPRDDAFLADPTTHSPSKICSRPRTATHPPRSPDARPQAARRTPTALTIHSPPKTVAPPSVPLRAQKNGTAQCMCDAECLGRPSLRSVIGVGEPRAVRRHFGALAWRVGLRPQPWALRSRRCGRVLRA